MRNPNPSSSASSASGSSSGLQKGKQQRQQQQASTTPCCSKMGMKRGPWTPEEDEILSKYLSKEGEGRWRTLPKRAGLMRCGKSCRLRWMNYLRPSIKHGPIAPDEEDLILRLHRLLGNRWSLIAGRIPGRTDNEIKNYWNTHLSKKLISQGIDPRTHKPLNPGTNPNLNPFQIPAQLPNSNFDHTQPVVQETNASGISNINNGYYDGIHSMALHASDNSAEDGLGIDCCNDDSFSSFLDSLINDDVFVQQENLHLQKHQHDGNEISNAAGASDLDIIGQFIDYTWK